MSFHDPDAIEKEINEMAQRWLSFDQIDFINELMVNLYASNSGITTALDVVRLSQNEATLDLEMLEFSLSAIKTGTNGIRQMIRTLQRYIEMLDAKHDSDDQK